MRFDRRCTLIFKADDKPYYDAILGKMVGGRASEQLVPANIGPVSGSLQNLLGDKLKEVTKVVRVRRCSRKVERLVIDGQPFAIVREPRHTNGMTVFYVREALNG